MDAMSLFEIRNNLIGVIWYFDDAASDLSFTEKDEKDYIHNHSNDGIYIYSVDNNKIIEKKKINILGQWNEHQSPEYLIYSYVVMENKLILRNYLDIDIYNLNNYKLLFKQNIDWTGFKIYPFDEKHFILFDDLGRKAIFKLYNINSMKNV